MVQRARAVHRAVDEGEVGDGKTRGQGIGDLHDGALPHAVGHKVGPGIHEDGSLQRVRPVVVVGQAPQAGLDAPQDDGRLLEGAADEVGIDHGRVVRAPARFAARAVGVFVAVLLVHRVVVHHGIHVAGGHEEAQARLAEDGHAFRVVPIGLGDDAHLVAVGFQHPGDDGRPEGGVVHVSVAGHVDEVELAPAPGVGLGPRRGQKRRKRHGSLAGRFRVIACVLFRHRSFLFGCRP